MKPILQTEHEAGKGNALQACVASILDADDIDTVPRFLEDPQGYLHGIETFVAPRGLGVLKVPLTDNNLTFPTTRSLCIVAGKSPRGDHKHCVVCTASGTTFELTHDPHKDGTGLDSHEWALFFTQTMM